MKAATRTARRWWARRLHFAGFSQNAYANVSSLTKLVTYPVVHGKKRNECRFNGKGPTGLRSTLA